MVYESTVYPGVTEDVCIPILEKQSGLKCGADFKVGYSPERINPGDKVHRLENIHKIVSDMDAEKEYNVELTALADVKDVDCIIVAVAHEQFKLLSLGDLDRMYNPALKNEEKILIDVKGIYQVKNLTETGFNWWRL